MASLLDVYQALRDCLGRDDLARLGAAIFLHEKGPPGYEAGYGYTDSGPLPEWQGTRKQIEGVCSELKRFPWRYVNAQEVREFWRKEWKATDPGWPSKVWGHYLKVLRMSPEEMSGTPIGRGGGRSMSIPGMSVDEKLQGSLSPQVQNFLQGRAWDDPQLRRALLIGLGAIGLAVVWYELGGRA